MKEKTREQEMLEQLNDLAGNHTVAMMDMSACLANLSEATEKTLIASRKAVKVSKDLTLLLLAMLSDSPDKPS